MMKLYSKTQDANQSDESLNHIKCKEGMQLYRVKPADTL